MWPSEDLASRLYDTANVGLVVGLIIGVISTVLLVWMGNVRDVSEERVGDYRRTSGPRHRTCLER